MSKTIEIRKVHIRNLFLSFSVGFLILLVLEHFGKFSYITSSQATYDSQGRVILESHIPYSTKVSLIYYDTFFENKITTSGNGFEVGDLAYKDADFYTYSNKIFYIIEALKIDYKYGIYISLFLYFVILLITNFKIKFT